MDKLLFIHSSTPPPRPKRSNQNMWGGIGWDGLTLNIWSLLRAPPCGPVYTWQVSLVIISTAERCPKKRCHQRSNPYPPIDNFDRNRLVFDIHGATCISDAVYLGDRLAWMWNWFGQLARHQDLRRGLAALCPRRTTTQTKIQAQIVSNLNAEANLQKFCTIWN